MEQKKKCFVCKKNKKLTEFYRHPQMSDGTVNKCKECNKKQNKESWWANREERIEYDNRRNRYSISRIFLSRYSGIKTRCTKGGSYNRKYNVTGMKFLSKQDWINWCYEEKNYKEFMRIYAEWVKNDFSEKFSPSIDRIDNKKSYLVGNLQWLSKSENNKKYNK